MSPTRRQVTGGAKGAAGKATDTAEQVKRTGEDTRAKAGEATEGVGAEGLFDSTEDGSHEPQTIRQELAAIVRETAIEVLRPVAREATKYAAKYAVQQGPKFAQKTLAPKLRNTLDSVADAGGPGAFAKDALGSVPSAGGGVLSRLAGGDQEDERQAWEGARTPLEEHVDVAVSLREAYEYFQRFERHIGFMSDHEQVEEVANKRIVWESPNRLEAICVITFHKLSEDLTRVMVTYETHPHGLQKATSALRLPRRMLRTDLMRFKSLVEVHPDEIDALYEEPEGEEPEAEEPEAEEPEAEQDVEPEAEEHVERDEDDEPEEEEEEPEQPKAPMRRRAQSGTRSRQRKPASKAAAAPPKRAVRSGSKSSSSAGSRRQAQPSSKSRQRARAKG